MRLSAACLALMLGLAPAHAADADLGREVARKDCSRCHVMPEMGNFGLGSAPSFKIMVKATFPDWRERFENFYELPPHPNFTRIRELPQIHVNPPVIHPFTLTLDDLDNLMAYVDRLAEKLRDKP